MVWGRAKTGGNSPKGKKTMNTNETNNNTQIDAVDAVNPATHGGITASAVATAESITNNAPIVARIRKGEIATATKAIADGWSAAFKHLGAFDKAPKWFEGATRFAFRGGDTRARRLTGEGEDSKGHAVIVNYVPTVRISTTDEKGQKSAVMVAFSFNKGGRMTQLNVPLLTIVPIPYIAINSVDINFKANINASSSSVSENSSHTEYGGEVDAKAKLNLGLFSLEANLKANYSTKKDSKATEESKYSLSSYTKYSVPSVSFLMPSFT